MERVRITDPEGEARTIELDPTRDYKIGRSPRNDLVLDDPSLSRIHAELFHSGGAWYIRDRGSANGTFVGETRISAPVSLAPGIRVVVGRSSLEIEGDGRSETHVALMNTPFDTAGATMFSASGPVTGPMSGPGAEIEITQPVARPEALRMLEFIERANLELLAHEPLDVLLPKVIDLIFEAVKPDRAALLALDEQGQLVSRAARADTGSIAISKTIASTVIEQQASILTQDAEGDARFGSRQSVVGLRALMAVPMIDRRGVSGLIYADSRSMERQFDEDDLRLLTVLAKVSAVQIENARLFQVHLEEQRLERELRDAAAIQRRLLPRKSPEIPGYTFHGTSIPCHEVGGDYFGCVPVDAGSFRMALADVSGKGMPAALLMAAFQSTWVARAETGRDLEWLVDGLNAAVEERAPEDRFVTLFAADLDAAKHRLRWANAGHAPPPLLLRASGESEQLFTGNVPVGMFPEFDYEVRELILEPGDTVFACSDGVTDAQDANGNMFGDERLVALLQQLAGRPAGEIVLAVQEAVRSFAGGQDLPDDVTLLALVREGGP
jgi:serine phosphatase RsbU (regulator of sigma subunit)